MQIETNTIDFASQALLRNKRWASRINAISPNLLPQMSQKQEPKCLWIGCVDSRVIPEFITDSKIGEMLVHRTVANTMLLSNDESKALLRIAVEVLKVQTIVVCGHSNCGAIRYYLENPSIAKSNSLFRQVRSIETKYRTALANSKDPTNLLSKLNVLEQLETLNKNEIIQKAKLENDSLQLHGFFFDINTGELEDISSDCLSTIS